MTSGIYTIASPSGKIYVGSARNLKQRRADHFVALARGAHGNAPLQRAYHKYGRDQLIFTILLRCSKNNLLMYEQRAIDVLNPDYNICRIAGSTLGLKKGPITPLHREKLRVAQKIAQNQPDTQRRRSDSLRGRPAWNRGIPCTPESNAKRSAALHGRVSPTKGKEPWNKGLSGAQIAWNKGIPMSAEQRCKCSAAQKGKPRSPESIARQKETIRRNKLIKETDDVRQE